jgi:cell division septal protein FtsQ
MSAVAAPADRRFRRHHVKPARRRRQWRAWIAPGLKYSAIAALLVFGVYRGGAVAAHAHVLQIDRIVVSGNVRLSKGEVLTMLGGLRGESLLFTDLDAWRKRLQASPWVREAALRRSLPSTVDVAIVERQPMGVGRINGEMYLVDEHGVIIDQYGPQYADLDLPIVDGLTMSDGGSLTDEARAEFAARVIASLRPAPRRSSSWGTTSFCRGSRRTSIWRRRCVSGSQTSTTSTCDSTIGCTCGRPASR